MVVLARYEDTNIEISQKIINYARVLGFDPGIVNQQDDAEILLTELDAIAQEDENRKKRIEKFEKDVDK